MQFARVSECKFCWGVCWWIIQEEGLGKHEKGAQPLYAHQITFEFKIHQDLMAEESRNKKKTFKLLSKQWEKDGIKLTTKTAK